MSGERKRIVKLFCPSLSKVAAFVALDDQMLDLGSMARAFGLEPSTLKLNGHFISRGVDFIASSVTWKSLLSFFSSRGLSTGASDADALVVDGKLCKLGTKRFIDYNRNIIKCDDIGLKRKQCMDDGSPLKRMRINGINSGSKAAENGLSSTVSKIQLRCSSFGESSKRMREDEIVTAAPSKRIR
ncbi:uncharacterized protein LOC127786721 [Diospyros lotus]|uniref:uncharacterized protein LOC127786721 n=1 Tax=Diospyros lotus TaxID=55363 RepID=UPI00224F230D|nr:uncharacterized protein LOC127786721 [Diospyros lotus]